MLRRRFRWRSCCRAGFGFRFRPMLAGPWLHRTAGGEHDLLWFTGNAGQHQVVAHLFGTE